MIDLDLDDYIYGYECKVRGFDTRNGEYGVGFEFDNDDRTMCISRSTNSAIFEALQKHRDLWMCKTWEQVKPLARQILRVQLQGFASSDELDNYLSTIKELENE